MSESSSRHRSGGKSTTYTYLFYFQRLFSTVNMSRNDLVSFKVFLKHGNDVEVRRFSVETDAVTNFIFLKEKLQSLFPILRDGDYKITWEGM